jgi:hypothetical protein
MEPEKKSPAYVQEYVRCVPTKYVHGPIRVNINLDKNGEALITLRNREFLFHVVEQTQAQQPAHTIHAAAQPAPTPVSLWSRLFGN